MFSAPTSQSVTHRQGSPTLVLPAIGPSDPAVTENPKTIESKLAGDLWNQQYSGLKRSWSIGKLNGDLLAQAVHDAAVREKARQTSFENAQHAPLDTLRD